MTLRLDSNHPINSPPRKSVLKEIQDGNATAWKLEKWVAAPEAAGRLLARPHFQNREQQSPLPSTRAAAYQED